MIQKEYLLVFLYDNLLKTETQKHQIQKSRKKEHVQVVVVNGLGSPSRGKFNSSARTMFQAIAQLFYSSYGAPQLILSPVRSSRETLEDSGGEIGSRSKR